MSKDKVVYSGPQKTNITQPSFYSRPNEDIQLKEASQAEYELDHLATLAISSRDGIESASDGMDRLQQMIASSGVWTMRVRLIIRPRQVCIIEKSSGKELEAFSASHIYDPVSFVGFSGIQQYNHIVIFTVRGETSSRTRNELHIFQCIHADEQEIIDDLMAANIGLFPRRKFKGGSAGNGSSYTSFDQHSLRSNSRSVYEEDVKLLNFCLEYIESFVNCLQQAAHAQKQLKKREDTETDIGEIEYLKKRSQPPEKDEFIEVLRQFKFTFNLLPKLKNFLKDPDAPELARHLFVPLALVVNSCRDKDQKPNLPRIIISPLLSVHACNLLHSCLHPPEMKLWKELGEAWNTPVEKWTGSLPEPYYPVFEKQTYSTVSSNISSKAETAEKGNTSEPPNQKKYLQQLKAKGAKIYVAKVTRTADPSKSKELSIVEGEYLEMLYCPEEKGWWKVSNISEKEGFVPKIIIQPYQ